MQHRIGDPPRFVRVGIFRHRSGSWTDAIQMGEDCTEHVRNNSQESREIKDLPKKSCTCYNISNDNSDMVINLSLPQPASEVRAGEALVQFELDALSTATCVHYFGEIVPRVLLPGFRRQSDCSSGYRNSCRPQATARIQLRGGFLV